MITKERLNEFIAMAYQTACDHGFHDEEKSNAHWMMLVVSEVGEMVEADRKGFKADISEFDCRMIDGFSYMSAFETTIKNSLADECADVCIRLFDFLGMKGIEPKVFPDGKDGWESYFGNMTICEQCYELVQGITLICNDSTPIEISEITGAMIRFCFNFAEHHGFDLEWHIVHKMKYNERRAKLHGKNY